MSAGWVGNAELVEKAVEVWVVAVVEDHEAGVDVPPSGRGLDRDRVGVAAGMASGLEDVHVVPCLHQLVGGDEAGDAGTDDRYPLVVQLTDA